MIQRLESEIDADNLRDDRDHDVIRVVVENDKGEKATAFVSVQMVGGRPRFTLTTKKNKGGETIVHATADWRL
jgi:hypothetical protein